MVRGEWMLLHEEGFQALYLLSLPMNSAAMPPKNIGGKQNRTAFSRNSRLFFSVSVPDYRALAATYCLFESERTNDLIDPQSIVTNKVTLLEHMTSRFQDKEEVKDALIEAGIDPDVISLVEDTDREIVNQMMKLNQYLDLLMEADPGKRPIRKTRYCLTYDNQYFEIDIYPFWHDKAILEIELQEEGEEIRFPKELVIRKEVTGDPAYKNSTLAEASFNTHES